MSLCRNAFVALLVSAGGCAVADPSSDAATATPSAGDAGMIPPRPKATRATCNDVARDSGITGPINVRTSSPWATNATTTASTTRTTPRVAATATCSRPTAAGRIVQHRRRS